MIHCNVTKHHSHWCLAIFERKSSAFKRNVYLNTTSFKAQYRGIDRGLVYLVKALNEHFWSTILRPTNCVRIGVSTFVVCHYGVSVLIN